MQINNKTIGLNTKPYIIAELSGNHNQSIDRAFEIVKKAAESGVDAIKLQTYTADTITMNQNGGLFEIEDDASIWKGKNLYQLYKEAYTPWEWHKPIFDYAASLGIDFFSSPFDESAVDFLETLNVPAYKIASLESTHYPLLKKVAKTGKPVIISSGTSSLDEIYSSVKYLKENGSKSVCVLKCTTTYPASPESTNLNTIPVLQNIFNDCIIGLSDHTMGIGTSIASIALGARVIEKHLTLRRSDGGVDSSFSLEPEEFKALVVESERAFLSLGTIQLDTQKAENKSREYRRSIFVSEDINVGELYSNENLKIIRPGNGIEPKYFDKIVGKSAKKKLIKGSPLSWDDIL